MVAADDGLEGARPSSEGRQGLLGLLEGEEEHPESAAPANIGVRRLGPWSVRRLVAAAAAVLGGLAALGGAAGLHRLRGRQANLNDVVDLYMQGNALLRSAKHPGSCLWVENGKAGTLVALRRCNIRDWKTTFTFPGHHGQIRVAGYPNLCIDGTGGRLHVSPCSAMVAGQHWKFGAKAEGIRLLHSPRQCLRATPATGPELKGDPASGWIGLADCKDDHLPLEDQWSLEPTVFPPREPSIYCMTIMMPFTYENQILEGSLWQAPNKMRDVGIYGCDGFQIFARQEVSLGWHHQVGWVHSRPFEQAPVGKTRDGWAAMVRLMINAWEAVREDGVYLKHSWCIKTDPDAIVVADRVRAHLRPHTPKDLAQLKPLFVRNCNIPGHPELKPPLWPMMHGPGEVMSLAAMKTYFKNQHQCEQIPELDLLGEDVWFSECLIKLGVGSIGDWKMLSDERCMDPYYKFHDCKDHSYGMYHAFKTVGAWWQCEEDAFR